MAERKPASLGKYGRARQARDDYDAPAGEDDDELAEVDEDAEYDDADGDAEYVDAAGAASADSQPDVLLDVPALKVEEINLEVEDLNARVSLQAEVLSLLRLHVGADVALGHVSLDIKGVDAVAHLKVRLDKVAAIIDRVMATIDENPQILTQLTQGLGEAARGIGEGAGEALEEVAEGGGAALESVGAGVQKAASDVGHSAGRAVEDVVDYAGDAVDDVRHSGSEAASPEDEGEEIQTGQRPAKRATARDRAARSGRVPASSRARSRPLRRQEVAGTTGSVRRDRGGKEAR